MMPYGMEYSFGQLRSAVAPPNSLCTPSLLPSGAVREAQAALMLCKHSSAIAETSIINTVFSTNPKHSPIITTVKKIDSIPAKTSTT